MAITDRIISWYAGGSTADEHGSNTLTANGTSPGYVTGKVGNAFDCDLTNQTFWSIAVGSAGDLQVGTRSLSYQFWFKANALPAASSALIRFGGISSANPGYHCQLSSTGQLLFRLSNGTTLYQFTATGTYSTGTWYHVRCTMDRHGFMRGYVDGIPVGAVSIAAASGSDIQSTEDFKIGGLYNQYYDGLIDEVMFYDGVMSSDLGYLHRNDTTGNDYATFSSITRPFVAEEFIHEQESNTTHAEVTVPTLVAGQFAVAILGTDGNITGATPSTYDGSWTLKIDGASPNTGTALTRLKVWEKEITATDASTETEFRVDWTSNEKAVLFFQLWENTVGMAVANESDTASAASSYTENGVTTPVDGCRIVMGIGIDGGTFVTGVSPAIPFNEYQVTNSAGHSGIWFGSEDKATAGATGSYAITLNASANAVPFSFAMEPVATGTTVDAAASDGLALSDAAASTLAALASALDGVTLTDTAAVSKALAAAAADGLSLSDVASVITILAATASDGLRFSDSATVSIVLQATASDGFTFSDGAVYPTGAAYVAATVTIANAIAASVSLQNAISATVTLKPD